MIKVTSYIKPKSLDEALELMAGERYTLIAGGTDVIPQLRRGKARKLIDINGLNLDHIKTGDNYIEFGAATTHTSLTNDQTIRKYMPVLSLAAGKIGSLQIRNRGTVGGNIINASPCADTAPPLMLYDAEVVLKSKSGERRVKLADFIIGPYETARQPDEILYSFLCSKLKTGSGFSHIKLGRRQAVNISRMTIATELTLDKDDIIKSARIAGGSVFPVPSRMPDVEDMLIGEKATSGLYEQAGKFAAELMIKASGRRWSTPYKEPVLAGLLQRALRQASSKETI